MRGSTTDTPTTGAFTTWHGMHPPKDCRLGKEQKWENKVANSATIAAAAINPSYEALLPTLAKLQDEEE